VRYVKGKGYYVKFYDHCINDGEDDKDVICETLGFYVKATKAYYIFANWRTLGTEGNDETFQILKKSIITSKKVK
jgi:hypothetical protein